MQLLLNIIKTSRSGAIEIFPVSSSCSRKAEGELDPSAFVAAALAIAAVFCARQAVVVI